MPRSVSLAVILLASGCHAGFTDTNPHPQPQPALDAGLSEDLTTGTATGTDAATGADAATDAATASGPQTIATGTFVKGEANGGDTGSGGASLVRASDGTELAVFAADFQSTPVPAGEVVLTSRAAIGTGGLQAGDLDLGPLTSATGAQQYKLPSSDGGRRNLFVYCVTYGVDVAIANLK